MLLNKLRRVTRDGRWIPEVDGLRFVAITSVVLFHLTGELATRSGAFIPIEPRYNLLFRLINNGDRGVAVFFVLSGFILALPFARHFLARAPRVSLRKFYLRRVTRLEPPYIAALLLSAAMIFAYSRTLGPGFFAHFFAGAFYVHTLIFHNMNPLNAVAWSLEVEIQFYILAPLFAQFLRIRPTLARRAILLCIIAACGPLQIHLLHNLWPSQTILYFVQYFLAGLLLADIYVLDMPRMAAHWAWDAVGLIGWLTVFGLGHDWLPAHALLPLILPLIYISAFKGPLLQRFFATPWIAVIGGMCYSIYLMHLILIAVVFKVTRHAILFHDFLANYILQVLFTALPVVFLCGLFYLAIERPCMDPAWPTKLWTRLFGKRHHEADILDTSRIGE